MDNQKPIDPSRRRLIKQVLEDEKCGGADETEAMRSDWETERTVNQ
jgi:hypothetical protein